MGRRSKTLVVLATLIGTFLAALDATVVGTAMPTIIGELGGLPLYPWAFASYLLAATVTGPVFGKLSDTYGRKPVYLVGIFLFLLGSALAGASQSMAALIAFRTLQGLGAGAVQPVAITIVGDIFELEARARIQGLFGAVWGISAILGPAVGGLLTDLVSWRWVFYLNIPFGLAAAVLLALTLTESFERRRRKVDYLGTALLTGGLVAVLLALLGEPGITAGGVAMFVGGVAMLALFVFVEGRAEDPIVPPDMFRDRILSVSAFGNLALGGVLLGVSVYVPLFVQGSLGGTALTAGAAVASLSIGWPVGSFVGGRMLLRTGYRATLLLGSAPAIDPMPCSAAPAENSPASSLSEKRAATAALSPPTSVSCRTSSPPLSTSLKSGGCGRSSSASSRPGSAMLGLAGDEVGRCAPREEGRGGHAGDAEDEQDPEGRGERGGEGAGELLVSRFGDAGADGRLQYGVGVREQTSQRRVPLRHAPYGGPVAVAEGGVEQRAHHGDPERAPHRPEEHDGGGRHPAPPPGHGVLDAHEVARAREAET